MLRVVIYFESSGLTKQIELTGLSKRINSIGLQPIPGDRFLSEDLIKDDRDKIESVVGYQISEDLVVKSRHFKFESTYAAVYIVLEPKQILVSSTSS